MLSWLLVSTISIYSCGHRHALGIVICSMKHSWPSDEEQSPHSSRSPCITYC
uniref:Uncharacterized protein n=1 Tax=Anguilla anguilla TaxID=7936 RepID=A0A0E9T5K3_ANGAN